MQPMEKNVEKQLVVRTFEPDMNALKQTAKQLAHMQDTSLNLYGQAGEVLIVVTARGELFHSLTLAPDSLLARIMGPGQHECNTFHHQAVRDVAPGFAAAAHAPDGLVEAVESADGLALGVQWHPENLAPEHPDHAAIFTWLVDAAAGGARLKR